MAWPRRSGMRSWTRSVSTSTAFPSLPRPCGAACARWGRMPEAEAPRRPGRLPYLLLSLILFLASAYFYQDPEWNGNSRLDLTRAVVEEGTVAIDAYQSLPQWDTNDKAFYNGHYYSDKA